ncbi:MAG: DUF4012 domain-containing protein [Parcubacteria group bacterium]|nr:DUF4012 domain-containing protein [Parcubacteria group bacterium]
MPRSPKLITKQSGRKKTKSSQSNQKNYKRTKITLLVLSVLLIIAVAVSTLSIKPAVGAYYSAMDGKRNVLQAQEYLTAQNFSAASRSLQEAESNFTSAKDNLGKLSWLRIVPGAGRQYKAAKQMAITGELLAKSLVSVSETVVEITEPISGEDASANNISSEEKRAMLQNLYRSTPTLQSALSNLKLAEIEADKIPEKYLVEQLDEASGVIGDNIPMLKDYIEGAMIASRYLPALAGYPEEETYLFLFQNNGELRPGGGFIGSYGIIKMKDGELTQMETDDTYNLDKESEAQVDGPWQIPTLLSPGIPSWYFRDSNWSPDFPTNAEKAEWFYHEEGGTEPEFGGVVAITPTFIEYLMELTGSIKIADHPKTFTSENVTDLIQHHVEQRFVDIGLPEAYRKNIIGELANVITDRLFSLPREEWDDLFLVLGKSIDEKHLSLYFNDDDIEKFFRDRNWASQVQDTTVDNDYLMVVDANLASRKTDFYMERSWNYHLDLTGEKPTVKLELQYHNTAPGISWKYTRYRTWTRVFAPADSTVVKVTGSATDKKYYPKLDNNYEVNQELGKTAIGTFFVVEPGAKKTITFEYELAEKTEEYLANNSYNLLVQKQIGTLKPDLNITIDFPDDAKPSNVSGEGESKIEGNRVEIDSDLLVDRDFTVDVN